jgi:tellurite resistance protein
MLWLSNSTLSRLRDQLRFQGRMPSIVDDRETIPMIDPERIVSEYGAICEAMYLMMTADGDVTEDEREVLRGAVRNLSNDVLGRADCDALLASAARSVAAEGRDARLRAVAKVLAKDRARAEVVFVLGAAIAFADNAIADGENETLSQLAEALGIDESRANSLLDDVERDLEAQRAAGGTPST